VSRFPEGLRPRAAAAIAGVLAWSGLAAAPLDLVRDCAAKVSPAVSGIANLGAACPEIKEALSDLGLTPILYDGWQDHLNRDGLRDLDHLVERYGGSQPGTPPDVAALPAVLEALAREQASASKSWWDSFGAWFKAWLAHHSDSLSWLDDSLERMGRSTTLFNVMSYSLVALVLMAAAAVIANELKANAAGRRNLRRGLAARETKLAAVAADSPQKEPVALAERLTELLRILVDRLMQTRRLETERSLTHRELVLRSAFDSESQRAAFAAVAGEAESILYGPHYAAPEQLNRVLLDGRALLAQLSDRAG
jgi:hypothetical protein